MDMPFWGHHPAPCCGGLTASWPWDTSVSQTHTRERMLSGCAPPPGAPPPRAPRSAAPCAPSPRCAARSRATPVSPQLLVGLLSAPERRNLRSGVKGKDQKRRKPGGPGREAPTVRRHGNAGPTPSGAPAHAPAQWETVGRGEDAGTRDRKEPPPRGSLAGPHAADKCSRSVPQPSQTPKACEQGLRLTPNTHAHSDTDHRSVCRRAAEWTGRGRTRRGREGEGGSEARSKCTRLAHVTPAPDAGHRRPHGVRVHGCGAARTGKPGDGR